MEETWWFIILVSLSISLLLKSLFNLLLSPHTPSKLPPGPPTIPLITKFLWLRKSFSDLEPLLRNLRAKYGPILTLRIGSRPAIFVATHSLAHQALVQNGAIFSDRPPALPTSRIMSSNQRNISSAPYGPTWRLLRRNLTSEILHPSRVKSYSHARTWVLQILIDRLKSHSEPVLVVDHFQYAMFCLLVLMCFGDKLEEKQIKEIETVQRRMLLSFSRFNILNFWPRLTRLLFRSRWNEFFDIRKTQEDVLIPLIRARKNLMKQRKQEPEKEDDRDEFVLSYVDTLLNLQLPDEKRELDEGEMVSLCSEFLNAGTDTTSTALQWIMANLVKYPRIQAKLFEEISGVVVGLGLGREEEIKEEHLQKMAYLKAIILEGLRRHPPGHFVLPHAVTEDVTLDGYVVPKKGSVNFLVAEMGWDPKVWEDPMEFKPERFLNGDGGGEVFDVTGSREIKMMPFGAGRRICPASGLAMLHLEYFVANLVWCYEWKAVDGDEVDMSEKQQFTTVMKNPLRAHISPRLK